MLKNTKTNLPEYVSMLNMYMDCSVHGRVFDLFVEFDWFKDNQNKTINLELVQNKIKLVKKRSEPNG